MVEKLNTRSVIEIFINVGLKEKTDPSEEISVCEIFQAMVNLFLNIPHFSKNEILKS